MKTPSGLPLMFFQMACSYKGDGCLLWPYSVHRKRYATMRFKGKNVEVHRLVCQAVHGDPPSQKHETAHSCGIPGCVNPQHLRWATHKENMGDTIVHGSSFRGERNPNARLTEVDVRKIRAQRYRLQKDLAAEYNVNEATIGHILTGYTWAWLED